MAPFSSKAAANARIQASIPAARGAAGFRASDQVPLKFGTKAETLDRLRPLVEHSSVLKLFYFRVEKWQSERERILDEIATGLPQVPLAVRSSAIGEDGRDESQAGSYTSVLDVDGRDPGAVAKAIDRVVNEYSGNPHDQVLVQPMLRDVALSGVILTYDIERGAPYYVLSYDDESGRTDSITGGTGVTKAVLVFRHANQDFVESSRIRKILTATREIELVCGPVPLDIEFAMTADEEVYVFQVRRISLYKNWLAGTEKRTSRQLEFVEQFIQERSNRRANLAGSYTILGNMPDWNPAEMIGETPRQLAASLYRELITRDIWRTARERMGYRPLPSEELMVMIGGHPYIDVRNSFNSLLPAGLDDDLSSAIVDAWLDRLNANPELHDKIEFEVAQTCLDFTFEEDIATRYPSLDRPEQKSKFQESLRVVTSRALSDDQGNTLDVAISIVDRLSALQRTQRMNRDPRHSTTTTDALRLFNDHIRECRTFGTLPFSVIARHAFIAEALLRSAVQRGALEADRLISFRRSVRTVTRDLSSDFAAVCKGSFGSKAFLHRYGHLRPGTYDITSLRYDERDDLFDDATTRIDATIQPLFRLRQGERAAINRLLDEAKLGNVDADRFMSYAAKSISGRESAKFVFTRSLSDALQAIVRWGEILGLGRSDLSHISASSMLESIRNPILEDADLYYLDIAEEGRRKVVSAQSLKLSYLIRDVHDIYVIPLHRSAPTFVGTTKIDRSIVALNPMSPVSSAVFDRIVCIENADPGYDWIFAKGVAGLVTKFGGANSHLAIRCAEFGIPAVIGCGEQTFSRLVEAGSIEMNCAEKVVRPVFGP